MKFRIENVEVYFPYDYIYPEQLRYMRYLKKSLDAKGGCLLEMPTGTGKTIALLSFITSYQLTHREVGKLIYCTRTIPEMQKALKELEHLIEYRNKCLRGTAPEFLGLGLSSRSNLCINPFVESEGTREAVDSKCRQRTAPWVREMYEGQGVPDIEDPHRCYYYEQLDRDEAEEDILIPSGVYTLTSLKDFGRNKGRCPYFLARHVISYANVVVCNYQYLIDPKVNEMVSHQFESNCVVVFDEAHNIDDIAIEALSVYLRKTTLLMAKENIKSLLKKVRKCEGKVREKLTEEHNKLVEGLIGRGVITREAAGLLANPSTVDPLPEDAIPGNIRQAEHFLEFMSLFLSYMSGRLNVDEVEVEGPDSFIKRMPLESGIDKRTLKACHDRLYSLINTLEIDATDELLPLRLLADFGTLIGNYSEGFQIIIEPYDERTPDIPDQTIHLACLDASIAMEPVFKNFRSVIITSGTLTPMEHFQKVLGFNPVVAESLHITLTRECLCPVVVKCGADQMPVSTKIEERNEYSVIKNYGQMILELCKYVPDGIVCFFVSYDYMKEVAEKWKAFGILSEISKYKLMFFESQDVEETSLALRHYRKACDIGRGGIFFSIARGKVAEGIDFQMHYGNCVVMIGIPYRYTLDRVLRERMHYLREKYGISNQDYLTFDAIRQAGQCAGRVIRDKGDYGLMVFADRRYGRKDKHSKLPSWIRQYLRESHLNLSTDMMLMIGRSFLRQMSQPLKRGEREQWLLTEEQARKMELVRELEEMEVD